MCHFSPFTLYKPYLMVCYMIRQCDMLQRSCKDSVLERDMQTFAKNNPGCSEVDQLKHAIKHVVPSAMPGTPAWHYQNLQDLFAMCEEETGNGMPNLFWTVTMDEVSQLKWQEVKDMEDLLKSFSESFTYEVSSDLIRMWTNSNFRNIAPGKAIKTISYLGLRSEG